MSRTKTLHAVFDGKVLRLEDVADLEPNVRYLVTIKRKEAVSKQSLLDVLSDSQEQLKDQKIGQKSMTIICMAYPSMEKGEDNINVDRFFLATGLCIGKEAGGSGAAVYWKRVEYTSKLVKSVGKNMLILDLACEKGEVSG